MGTDALTMSDTHVIYSIVLPAPTGRVAPEADEQVLESQRAYIERMLRVILHDDSVEVKFVATGTPAGQ